MGTSATGAVAAALRGLNIGKIVGQLLTQAGRGFEELQHLLDALQLASLLVQKLLM